MTKKIFLFLLLQILNHQIKGQYYKISYQMNFVRDTISKQIESKDMVLLVLEDKQIFCSEKMLTLDSLYSKNGEKVFYYDDIEFMLTYEKKHLNMYYFIDNQLYDKKKLTDDNKIEWKIHSQKKIIGDFECYLATTIYRGRHWEAWFSQDVNLPYGPYTFRGLPGLIIQISDTKKHYEFNLTAIKPLEIRPNFSFLKPLTVTQKQLEKVLLTYYADPYRRLKEKGIIKMADNDGNIYDPPDFDKMGKIKQEYVKRHNNPIELTEAIKYP